MFKITRLVTVLVFLLTATSSYSQDKTIDSLKGILKNQKLHDTTRIRVMNNIIEINLQNGYPDKDGFNKHIKTILDQNLKKKDLHPAEVKAYKLALANWYFNEGAKIFSPDNAPKVIYYFDLAIALFKEIGDEEDQWTAVLNKSMILRNSGRSAEAFDCMFAALKHHEQKKDLHGIAQVNTMIGLAYQELGDSRKAIPYYEKVLQYNTSLKKPSNEDLYEYMIALGNIAVAYKDEKQPSKARPLFFKAITIAKKLGNDDNIALGFRGLADMDLDDKNYEEAIKKYKEGLLVSKNPADRAYLLMGLWKAYFATNRNSEGKKYLLEAQLNAESSQNSALMVNIYGDLYQMYKAENNYKLALEMLEKHRGAKESMGLESAKNKLKEQQLKYTYEKKELKLKLDAEKKTAIKNNWLIGLSGLLLLILIGAYFYYRNNKQKQAIAGLEKNQIKQKLLITQMNPHFIFNSIQNIRSLIFNKQDQDAVNYLDKFSKLTRQILENSNENYISLAEEVEMIENYLAIQQLLYNNKFTYSVAVEEAIDSDSIFLPPMLTQPFIENAIKHGLSDTSVNGKVDIHFYLKETKLFFEVTDNGKGFDAVQKSTNHKSLAMTITKERLVNYTKNQDFVVVTDNILDKETKVIGAKVVFEIPYIYEN